MMAKMFEKKLKRKLNNEENDKLFDKFQTILNDRYTSSTLYLKNIDGDTNILLKKVDLEYLKRFSEKLSERIELGYISIIDIPDSEPITGELKDYFPETP